MSTTTQKALIVTALGEPVSLIHDHPTPQPGPNQVQIRVTVAGLNPHDQKARDGGLFIASLLSAKTPAVLPTMDVVGRITALGPGVSTLGIGDRVVYQPTFAPENAQKGMQQYTIADLVSLAKIPDSVSDDDAATLPANCVAPMIGIFHTLRIPAPWTEESKGYDYEGTTLLIVGGGSTCGRFGVQLAKLAGVGRIVVVGGDEEELKGMGATHVLSRHGAMEEVLERIRAVVGDELVYAFDAVNDAEGIVVTANALSSYKRGAVARLIPLVKVNEGNVLGKRAGFEIRDVMGSCHAHPELAKGFWERVMGWMEEGKVRPSRYVVREGGLDAGLVNGVLDGYRDGERVVKTHVHF